MKWALVAVIVIAVLSIVAFVRLPSARQLEIADRAWPVATTAVKIVDGASFGSDPRQRLDVWRPLGNAGDALPVVVWFYGGSWNSGDRGDYGFAARALAEMGYVVVIPDYRLVPAVRYPAFLEDAAAAVGWTTREIARFGGDPARIALVGHSAGAYNAVSLALDPRWLQAAGVDPAAVMAVAGLAGPYDFYPFTTDSSRAAFGAAPDPAATQPITYARADAPPLFLAHGTADTTVKPHNSRALAKRLGELGAPPTLREYEGLDHYDIVMTISRPFSGKAPVLADMRAFLDDAFAQQ